MHRLETFFSELGRAMVTAMNATAFESYGYVIDLEVLYQAMYDLRISDGPETVYNGGLAEVRGVPMRAMKRLLNDLFGVPATENYHYTGDRVRSATRDHLEQLGWASNMPRGTPRYVLHRELSSSRSFLLTWNPTRGFAWDARVDILRRTSAGERVSGSWSVGSRKSGFAVGDMVYLIRLGDEPRGIVASGTVSDSTVHRRPHWNGHPGKTANSVDVVWDRAVDDSEILSDQVLQVELPDVGWFPQSSGVLLEQRDALRVAQLWNVGPVDNPHNDPTERRQAREAGYQADSAVRTAIEKHAEGVGAEHYDRLDYDVDFVGTFRSYDLHVTHRITGQERHVEVKGTSGEAATVELTSGEVDQARNYQPTDLFVVSEINWQKRGGQVTTSGGTARKYSRWAPDPTDLTAIRFRCQVPPRGKNV